MELCRDVRNIIIRKMDIDTRRTLGIYTKINCPKPLQNLITSAIDKLQVSTDKTYVCLGSMREQQSKYEICRFFENKELVDARLHYFPPDCNMIMIVPLDDSDEG